MLAPDRGAFRVVLTESQWRGAWSTAGLPESPVQPLPGEDREEPDDTVVQTVRLAHGQGARVSLEVTGAFGDRGTVGRLGFDDAAAAHVVRALVVQVGATSLDGVQVAPEVEVSLLPVERVVDEVLTHFPAPSFLPPADGDTGPWELSPDHARLLAHAGKGGERGLADLERALGETPEVLRETASGIRGNITVGITVAGEPSVGVRRWLLTTHGWIGLSVVGGVIRHELHDRAAVRAALVEDLAIAASAARRRGRESAAGGSDG